MALNVLVVDDSATMRKIIIKTLMMSGLPLGELYEAGNGVEGLEVINNNWIDLALVDINMPVMTGEEMIDKLRHNPDTADIPVIVVSTESSTARIDMLQHDGVGFVHKPFTPERLRETVLAMIGDGGNGKSGERTIQLSDNSL
jgi:two-component system chemotaxis response regulator CheY